jgi:hypothetical protein
VKRIQALLRRQLILITAKLTGRAAPKQSMCPTKKSGGQNAPKLKCEKRLMRDRINASSLISRHSDDTERQKLSLFMTLRPTIADFR